MILQVKLPWRLHHHVSKVGFKYFSLSLWHLWKKLRSTQENFNDTLSFFSFSFIPVQPHLANIQIHTIIPLYMIDWT